MIVYLGKTLGKSLESEGDVGGWQAQKMGHQAVHVFLIAGIYFTEPISIESDPNAIKLSPNPLIYNA